MSGNSSVCSRHSANSPNTTSATIVTTVIIGRLIAKSEITIKSAPPWRTTHRWRRDAHRSSGRNSLSGADQQRVAGGQSRQYFRRLRRLVVDSDLHLNLLHLSALYPHHRGRRPAKIDRRRRNYEPGPRRRRHPAAGEQAADQSSSGVRNRDVDAHLP